MSNLSLFIPITKVDALQRLVYGTLTEEVPDKAGEIFDYATGKDAFIKWSSEIEKSTDGKSKGNLRAMHDNIAAGKFTDLVFDDDAKRIEGVAKVVDDNEWNKVLEGVYTGFSIGGGYAKRWTDPENPQLKRYTPELSEVSLVDNPCVPTATFEFIKEDGSTELRKFNAKHEVSMADEDKTKPEGEQKTETVEKAAAETTTNDPDPAEAEAVAKSDRPQDKGGVVQGFQARDGSFHLKKADALKRNSELDAQEAAAPALEVLNKLDEVVAKSESKLDEAAVEKAAEGAEVAKAAEGQPEEEPKGEEAEKAADKTADQGAEKAAPAAELKKGMYAVASFADLLERILYLQQDSQWEADWEGDNSELPAKLKAWLAEGGALLVQMVSEETAELTAQKAAGGDLAKKGAKLSAASKEHIDKMRKSARAHMDAIEGSCKALGLDEEAQDDEGAEKMAKRADEAVLAENTALKKALGDMTPRLEGLLKKFEEQNERIAHLEKQPMPAKGPVRVVEKANDGGNDSDGDIVKKFNQHLESLPPEEKSKQLMKLALANPVQVTR
jgi:hypothetical protein